MINTRLAATLSITLLPSLALAADYQGDLYLASQSDVDAASAYTGVTGNLTISGGDIVDLGPLAGFTQVGGYISMQGNPSLTQVIGGFPSLTNVGGGMFFYNNDSLLDLSGFDALGQTGDNIDFWFNDVLRSVSGFASLHTAGWSLEFGDNPNLVEIPEFLSLQTIDSSLFILDNNKLEAITGFQALQFVSWSFQIQNNTNLNDLCGLYNYFTVNNPYTGGGAFDINNNGPGLPNPTTEQDVINAGPCTTGTPYCFGNSASGNPCPCGNDNDGTEPKGGCQHDDSLAGARLDASGLPSVTNDTLVLAGARGPFNNSTLFFQANNNLDGNGAFLGDGIRCAGGGLIRLKVKSTDANGEANSMPAVITTRSAAFGHTIVAGETLYYQWWFRDSGGSLCGAESNTSNGLEITWIP
jgi:hypothetical protein